MVGQASTGKSTFLHRLQRKPFSSVYDPSDELASDVIDVKLKNLPLQRLQVWDVFDEYEYLDYEKLLQNVKGVLLFFDTTKQNVFELRELMRTMQLSTECRNLLVVGTKADLVDKRAVSFQQMSAWCL